MSEGTEERHTVLDDVRWRWRASRALVACGFIGLGTAAWGLGADGVGQLMLLLGMLWYAVSPTVQVPSTS